MAKLKHFRILKIKHFVLFLTITLFVSCNETPKYLSSINGLRISIDSSHTEIEEIKNFILPYRSKVDEILDSTLAYAPFKISKTDGPYNTTAGNLMADLMLSEAGPIFKERTGNDLDFILMNHGGIRSVISKGNVSARTAYEVMPFENTISVVELDGKGVKELVNYLVSSKRAHPVAGIQIILNPNDSLNSINIQGKPFNENRNYNIATSNYLVSGGDDMVFFKNALNITEIDYKIRNAMIDYFKKVDTLAPVIDNRYYKLTK